MKSFTYDEKLMLMELIEERLTFIHQEPEHESEIKAEAKPFQKLYKKVCKMEVVK